MAAPQFPHFSFCEGVKETADADAERPDPGWVI